MRKFYDEPPDGTMKEVTPSERAATLRRLVDENRLGSQPHIGYVKELLDIIDINRDITNALANQHYVALNKIKRLEHQQDVGIRAIHNCVIKLAGNDALRKDFNVGDYIKFEIEKAEEELAQEKHIEESHQDMVDAVAFSLKVNPPNV